MENEFRYIVRIAGTDIDGSLNVEYGLTKIKGLSINLSKTVVGRAKISRDLRIGDLNDADVERFEAILKDLTGYGIPSWMLNRRKDVETGDNLHLIGPDLTLRIKSDIENMIQMRSWRGTRHAFGLKVRGQRTKTTGRSGRAVGVRRRRVMRTEQGGR
jgi:small subunit ribosomal protein S13